MSKGSSIFAFFGKVTCLWFVFLFAGCTATYRSFALSGLPQQKVGGIYISTQFPEQKYQTVGLTQITTLAISVAGALDTIEISPDQMLGLLILEAKKYKADGVVIQKLFVPNPPVDAEKGARVAAMVVSIAQQDYGVAMQAGAREVAIVIMAELIRFVDE